MIGAGWVGLVTAACFAELGHEVYVRDIVQEKVDSLARGEVPIYEPGLSELLTKNAERLHFTTDMGDVLPNAELLFCCVDTPPSYSGDADLSRVERVVEEVGASTRPRARDEEHRAGRHRPLDPAHRRAASATCRTPSS